MARSSRPAPRHRQRISLSAAAQTCRQYNKMFVSSSQNIQLSSETTRYYLSDREKLFRGHIVSEPQTVIMRPAPETRDQASAGYQVGATTVSSLTGNLLKINCNAGLGYEQIEAPDSVETLGGMVFLRASSTPPVGETASYALYSEQYTNLLRLSLESPPPYISAGSGD